MPRKLLLTHCMICTVEPIAIKMKPNGLVLKDGTGYCVTCYERAVRSSVDTGRAREYGKGTDPVIGVF